MHPRCRRSQHGLLHCFLDEEVPSLQPVFAAIWTGLSPNATNLHFSIRTRLACYLGRWISPLFVHVSLDHFRCGACGYTGQSMIIQRISTAGWVTFGVLMVTCLPLFWIGLLIKENRCQCPNCRIVY